MSWDHAEAVYKNKSIKGTAKTVLAYLAHRADENDKCWPSRDTIAEETGIAIKTVSQAIKRLKDDEFVAIDRKQYYQIYTLQMLRICTSESVQMLRKGHSDSADLPSDVTLRDSDSADLPSDVTDLPPNSNSNSQLNSHSNGQVTVKAHVMPNEDFGTGLKFNKGIIQNVFGPKTESIWPTVRAIQENCDMPSWKKFEAPIYELIGYEIFPKPDDVLRVSRDYRKKNPDDDFWPSTFTKIWRRELIARKNKPSSQNQKKQIQEKNARIFKNKGIVIPKEVPF